MSKYTSSPWEIDEKNFYTIKTQNNYVICGVSCVDIDKEEIRANTHLIAAAPELLETAEELTTKLIEEVRETMYDHSLEVNHKIGRVLDAIQKAKGEDNNG